MTTDRTTAEAGEHTDIYKIADDGESYELAPGMLVGEYAIEALIGEGGMGVVYSAVHPVIGKRAAIKVLRQELCQDEQTVERFVAEARIVNQIGHPNIVDVFAFGEMVGGRRYFVMELLTGESLRTRIRRGALAETEFAEIIVPLTRALAAAHGKGVIHRDLKPDNIFLVDGPEGRPIVKLLDFGVAKLVQSTARQPTAIGTMVGTPMYFAPEQAAGGAIDHRADIYSVGVILFELLTRRTPFVTDNPMEMVAKHVMEVPPAVSSLRSGVPPELERIVMAMLAKDPAARPTLAAVGAALASVQWRAAPTRRSKRPLIIGGILAVAAIAGALLVPRLLREPAPAPSEPAPHAPIVVAEGSSDAALAVVSADTALAVVSVDAAVAVPVVVAPPIVPPMPPVVAATPPIPPVVVATPPTPPVVALIPPVVPPTPPVVAPVPARPRTRDIHLTVVPSDAQVRFDGIAIGNTVHLPLDGKRHTITVTAHGFASAQQPIDAGAPASLRIELARLRPISL